MGSFTVTTCMYNEALIYYTEASTSASVFDQLVYRHNIMLDLSSQMVVVLCSSCCSVTPKIIINHPLLLIPDLGSRVECVLISGVS